MYILSMSMSVSMSMFKFICIYICMCMCMFEVTVRICVSNFCRCVSLNLCICVGVKDCKCICLDACVHAKYVSTYVCQHSHVHILDSLSVYIYIHTPTHAYTQDTYVIHDMCQLPATVITVRNHTLHICDRENISFQTGGLTNGAWTSPSPGSI